MIFDKRLFKGILSSLSPDFMALLFLLFPDLWVHFSDNFRIYGWYFMAMIGTTPEVTPPQGPA